MTFLILLHRSAEAYYTEAKDKEEAVTNVIMRVKDQYIKPGEGDGFYIERMKESTVESVVPWEMGYPQLTSRHALDLLFWALKEFKKEEAYNFNWKRVDKTIKQWVDIKYVSQPDADMLRKYLQSLPEFEGQMEMFPPEPASIWTHSFTKETDKNHPGAPIADSWKITHPMEFMTIDHVAEAVGSEPIDISVKLDGELSCLYYSDKKAVIVTARGTVRADMPPTTEATQLLSKYNEAVFMAELYVVDEKSKPVSYMKGSSVIRDPQLKQDQLIRLSVFDVVSLDGKDYAASSMSQKKEIIDGVFKSGKAVHPAPIVTGTTIAEARKMWDQIEDLGWEGLIIYSGSMIYKIKPIISYDMAIVAIDKSPKYVDRIGAVLCAFVDKEGRFRLNGSVGGGFTDSEKTEMLDWAERNKVWEDETRIWVDPFKEPIVVEVEAMEVNVKDRPALEFKDKKWVEIEQSLAGVLRHPHFKRFRDDKKPRHEDVPVEQLPLKKAAEEAQLTPGNRIKMITGQTGKIVQLVPRSGDSGWDFDVIVEWDQPLWGKIPVCEVHPTEIQEIMV